jgi:hypothetical protein
LDNLPNFVPVKIRRIYQVALVWGRFFLYILPIDKFQIMC